MPSDLNKIILIGRLVRDPELRYTPNGTAVASFSIANNRTYNTGGEKKDQVSFFNCVAWSKLGEVIVQYCKKGQRVALDGRLQQRAWEDQQGNKRSAVEVVVENFQFLTPREQGEQAPAGSENPLNGTDVTDEQPSFSDIDNPFNDEDCPF